MIYSIFEKLLSTNSRLEKEAIMREHAGNETFKNVCYLALNPYIKFNIRKIPKFASNMQATLSLDEAMERLMKLADRTYTGHAGVNWLENILSEVSEDDAKIIIKIIQKDLKCGVQKATVNKTWTDLIPGFEVQLAQGFNEKNLPIEFCQEPKLDGMRCVILCDNDGEVTFFSRGGKEIETLDHLKNDLITLNGGRFGFMFDSEVTAGSFQNTMSVVKRLGKNAKSDNIYLNIFDMMTYDEFKEQKCFLTYRERRAQLEALFDKPHSEFLILNEAVYFYPSDVEMSREEFIDFHFHDHMDRYGEGSIIKDVRGLYTFDRTAAWIKIKAEKTFDVEIKGYFKGTGKNANRLGGFIYELDGVDCRVGGGFSDKQRDEFWEKRDEMIGSIMEILTNEKTDKGATRHSRFKAIRSFKGEKA